MNVGFDGMIIDAVNWYVGYNWETRNRHITEPIAGYGDPSSQPEGGVAFHIDDPVGWITEGYWTNLQDYGLGIWWEKDNHPLVESVEKGDPRMLGPTAGMQDQQLIQWNNDSPESVLRDNHILFPSQSR